MNTNYTDMRMNLNEVCNWLTNQGYEDLGNIIKDKFTYHTWVKDGMMRKDVVEDIFERCFGERNVMFRQLQCDVTTTLSIIPLHEAHVD